MFGGGCPVGDHDLPMRRSEDSRPPGTSDIPDVDGNDAAGVTPGYIRVDGRIFLSRVSQENESELRVKLQDLIDPFSLV